MDSGDGLSENYCGELDGHQLLVYFQDVLERGDLQCRPMCLFFIPLMAFIPTSVLCERSFSIYNSAMRSDRSSLGNQNVESYLILKSGQKRMFDETFENKEIDKAEQKKFNNSAKFDVMAYKHLFPFVVRSGRIEYQDVAIEKAAQASRSHYRRREELAAAHHLPPA